MQKLLIVFLFLSSISISAQTATIYSELMTLKTYPFSDPNPIPILADNPLIYPYFKYEGYSHDGVDKEWNVVILENDYIKVFVLPEIGGKVWGAIDKSNGQEYIYRNEVVKFRNIAMRGPWTSGGIEFNFGVIGHHPSTATPVDYNLSKKEDGSVICTVGAMDLPSRTHWRVKIILQPDKAYFTTEAGWYNPTPFEQAYYNWMTGAAFAQNDLVIYAPGDKYLDHGGGEHPYPIDEKGRNLSVYRENNFGPSKSYHVVGAYNDFFGGYFKEDDYGFGHWARYEDMPGQKIWLWALSRAGGIWEDLLTDTDGQYIEFQAGRMLNQYAPNPLQINPTSKASFAPDSYDSWEEIWFPVNGIGGISDVSDKGVLHVEEANGYLNIGINSFSKENIRLEIYRGNTIDSSENIPLKVMEPVIRRVARISDDIEIKIPELKLSWKKEGKRDLVSRKYTSGLTEIEIEASNAYRFYLASQAYASRHFNAAEDLFLECIKKDPLYIRAHSGLAELYVREGKFDKAINHIEKALRVDNYDAHSNYLKGITSKYQNKHVDALESFSWALRSPYYRSTTYAAMAEIFLIEGHHNKALEYADKAIVAEGNNLRGRILKVIALRSIDRMDAAANECNHILEMDPLNHAAIFEKYMLSGNAYDKQKFLGSHQSEFAYQTVLELVCLYERIGARKEALAAIELYGGQQVMIQLWKAFLSDDEQSLHRIAELSERFVFPYRQESLDMLRWALNHHSSWKYKYYLSLNLLGLRHEQGYNILQELGDEPNSAVFYLSRAKLLPSAGNINIESDLSKANELSDDWRIDHALATYYMSQSLYVDALKVASEGLAVDDDNITLSFDAIKAHLHLKQYDDAIKIIDHIRVLPFEGAAEGRLLYEVAYVGKAMQLMDSGKYEEALPLLEKGSMWDENMGVGKPYEADERLILYLLSKCYDQLDFPQEAVVLRDNILTYTSQHIDDDNPRALLGLQVYLSKGLNDEFETTRDRYQNMGWIKIIDNLSADYDREDLLIDIVVTALLQK